MSDPLTDQIEFYQLQAAGFETWMLTSKFHECPAAWIELVVSWGTMAIIRHFQRLIFQDGVNVQAFSGAGLLAGRQATPYGAIANCT